MSAFVLADTDTRSSARTTSPRPSATFPSTALRRPDRRAAGLLPACICSVVRRHRSAAVAPAVFRGASGCRAHAAGRGSVLHAVRLVHNHEVVVDRHEPAALRGLAHERERGHHQGVVVPRAVPGAARGRDGGRHGRQTELRRQLVHPLADERGRCQDQRLAYQTAQPVLLQRQAGFDRLAQPHLVGQQDAASEVAQDPPHRLELVAEVHHVVDGRERHELVEALLQAQPRVVTAQQDIADRRLGLARRHTGQKLTVVDVNTDLERRHRDGRERWRLSLRVARLGRRRGSHGRRDWRRLRVDIPE